MPFKHLPKQFQGIVEATNYVEPEVNIEEEIKTYVDGVINKPKDEQEHLVKQSVASKVRLALHSWKSNYRQNDEIIENMDEHHKRNEESIEELKKEKKILQKKADSLKSAIYSNEQELEEIEKNAPKGDFNKKFTLIFLLAIAFGLAALTAYKFSIAMTDISTSFGKHGKPEWYHYLLYGFGSFAVLATGKLINIAYEKLNHSKKFFLTIIFLGVGMATMGVYYVASDKAFLNTKAQLVVDKKSIKQQIDDISPEEGETISNIEQKELDKLQKKYKQITEKLDNSTDEAIGLDKKMVLIIFLTEMLVGGVVWMYATDYARFINKDKRVHTIEALKKHIEDDKAELKELTKNIDEIEDKIEFFRLENHDLHRVISTLKTEDEIEEALNLVIKNETDKALSYLWSKQG